LDTGADRLVDASTWLKGASKKEIPRFKSTLKSISESIYEFQKFLEDDLLANKEEFTDRLQVTSEMLELIGKRLPVWLTEMRDAGERMRESSGIVNNYMDRGVVALERLDEYVGKAEKNTDVIQKALHVTAVEMQKFVKAVPGYHEDTAEKLAQLQQEANRLDMAAEKISGWGKTADRMLRGAQVSSFFFSILFVLTGIMLFQFPALESD